LVRAANRIGLKARILTDIGADRLASIPKPALLKLRSGAFVILGGFDPAGRWRLIDPATFADRYLERDSLRAEIEPLAILVGRRCPGAATRASSSIVAIRRIISGRWGRLKTGSIGRPMSAR
jgi:hypothetical protein